MIDQAPLTEEEFEAWLDYPATKWVLAAARALASDRKEAWVSSSWHGGQADEKFLRELRGQADAHLWLADIDYHAVCTASEQEPVTDSR